MKCPKNIRGNLNLLSIVATLAGCQQLHTPPYQLLSTQQGNERYSESERGLEKHKYLEGEIVWERYEGGVYLLSLQNATGRYDIRIVGDSSELEQMAEQVFIDRNPKVQILEWSIECYNNASVIETNPSNVRVFY